MEHTNKTDILCPNCGSEKITEVKNEEVTLNEVKLKEYDCADCQCKFIPAITESKVTTNITRWANKMATRQELNEGKSWNTKQKVDYIIIKRVK